MRAWAIGSRLSGVRTTTLEVFRVYSKAFAAPALHAPTLQPPVTVNKIL